MRKDWTNWFTFSKTDGEYHKYPPYHVKRREKYVIYHWVIRSGILNEWWKYYLYRVVKFVHSVLKKNVTMWCVSFKENFILQRCRKSFNFLLHCHKISSVSEEQCDDYLLGKFLSKRYKFRQFSVLFSFQILEGRKHDWKLKGFYAPLRKM